VVSEVQRNRVLGYLKKGVVEGAETLLEGGAAEVSGHNGHYVKPALLAGSLENVAAREEIFGPVLHVATFAAKDLDKVVDSVNAKGYGLTFGVHSRVDRRVERIASRIKVGNTYVNRNQIGAIVGSQPFGGEGLSGTGPKAGGPQYVRRFLKGETVECQSGGYQEA